jgi:DNA-binding NarL/FixJ family response regulator
MGRTFFASSFPSSPSENGPSTPVWVVDNDESQRQRLVDVIDEQPDLNCALASGRGEDAIEALAQNEAPQVVLMALELPGMTGIETTCQIKGRSPTSQVIALTTQEDEDQIRELLCAGACGCLLQSPSDEQVVGAIAAARSNGAPMSPSVARTVLRLFRQHVRPRADYGLTPREREVLRLLVEDYTQKEIAEELFVSPHTVDTHLRNIYRKLEVRSRSGAIVKALHERLL